MRSGLHLSRSHQVFASFAIYSFAMGNIFPRLGDVQLQMGVTTGQLGLGLIGAPLGTLINFFIICSPEASKVVRSVMKWIAIARRGRLL